MKREAKILTESLYNLAYSAAYYKHDEVDEEFLRKAMRSELDRVFLVGKENLQPETKVLIMAMREYLAAPTGERAATKFRSVAEEPLMGLAMEKAERGRKQ